MPAVAVRAHLEDSEVPGTFGNHGYAVILSLLPIETPAGVKRTVVRYRNVRYVPLIGDRETYVPRQAGAVSGQHLADQGSDRVLPHVEQQRCSRRSSVQTLRKK